MYVAPVCPVPWRQVVGVLDAGLGTGNLEHRFEHVRPFQPGGALERSLALVHHVPGSVARLDVTVFGDGSVIGNIIHADRIQARGTVDAADGGSVAESFGVHFGGKGGAINRPHLDGHGASDAGSDDDRRGGSDGGEGG